MNWRHCGSTVFIEESRCQNKEGKNMSGKQQLNCFEAAEGSWLRECNCIKTLIMEAFWFLQRVLSYWSSCA